MDYSIVTHTHTLMVYRSQMTSGDSRIIDLVKLVKVFLSLYLVKPRHGNLSCCVTLRLNTSEGLGCISRRVQSPKLPKIEVGSIFTSIKVIFDQRVFTKGNSHQPFSSQ